MKRLTNVLMAALTLLLLPALPAAAQVVSAKTVSACGTPGNTPVVGNGYPITMDQTGTLCTNATVTGGGTTVKATAAAPTYVEGSTTNPLSTDLSGNLRVGGTINATSTVKATAADPTYVEGSTSNPVSVDLSGYARSLSKQSGTWNITNISGTVSLPTGASTAANQTTANSSLSTIATNSGTQATAANQTTGNSSLSTIATNTGTTNTNLTNVTGTKAAGTAAANSLLTGCVYNSTPLTLTNGQQAGTGCTVKGNVIAVLGDPTTGSPLDPTAASAVQCGTTTGTMAQCGLDNVNGTLGSTAPTRGTQMGAKTGANMDALVQAGSSAAINVSTATTTQIVALASSQKIYVTSFDVIAGGTGNITFVYGTGSNCGTGTTSLTGAYPLTAQAGIAKGNGLGPVLVVPASNALCVTTSAAVQMSGSVSYAQF